MRCADFLRAKESARNAVAHAVQFVGDLMEAESKMGVHVFEEDLAWLDLADNARDVRPEVPRVFLGELLAGATERLARITRAEDVRLSFVGASVKCLNVAPKVRRSQGAVFKTRNQDAGCRDFPFHEHERESLSESKGKSKAQASVPGAEFNDGRYSHIYLVA